MHRNTPPRSLAASQVALFLGGRDLEMVTIAECASEESVAEIHDHSLAWGAHVNSYRSEIHASISSGRTLVLVELDLSDASDIAELALPFAGWRDRNPSDEGTRILILDHHGSAAGADAPTSLDQFVDLIGVRDSRWSRWYALVAANDRAHIAGMLEIGASRAEVVAVRAADRAAQGITNEEERVGAAAAIAAERPCDELTIVRLPHDRTATVTDPLDPSLGGRGFSTLLICTPDAAHVYADGPVIAALADAFPDGWYGGDLPRRGFWGRVGASNEIEAFVRNRCCRASESQ